MAPTLFAKQPSSSSSSSSLLELQSPSDLCTLSPHLHQKSSKVLWTAFHELPSMEFVDVHNDHNDHDPLLNHQHQSYEDNISIPVANSNQHHPLQDHHDHHHDHSDNTTATAPTQLLSHTHRQYMSGYHHQHIGTDYEQVISFVDSPPNSEESWSDEPSKGSPGPQIINVQTIYGNSESGSRKRRMDWDSLDIGQSGSPAQSVSQSAELSDKLSPPATADKEKYKREKLSVSHSGRANWSDDIGFDLNAEFSSNSYLNNCFHSHSESFMPFSPGLTVLKQEPQTEQLKVNVNKTSVNSAHNSLAHSASASAPKIDRSSAQSETVADKLKHDLNDNLLCGRASPPNAQQVLDQRSPSDKSRHNVGEHAAGVTGVTGESFPPEKGHDHSPVIAHQPLPLVDSSRIEQSTGSGSGQSDDHKFQYILAAATSIATRNNEETLTYLNQGQSYEIKLKKIGDLTFYRDKILKSVIKICFHERRLQFMEREQMQQWQTARPGERIIEVDVPLSYGLCHVSQPLNPNYLNTVEVFWDPLKEVGVYIKVNCISTEFTPKKHGGEKGVPFRLQIETYIDTSNTFGSLSKSPSSPTPPSPISTAAGSSPSSIANLTSSGSNIGPMAMPHGCGGGKQPVHAAACQIKVFKLKGADRKHKQDREKIQRRPQAEQDKFQPSYECTIMNDLPLELLSSPAAAAPGCFSPEHMKVWPNSPVHIPKYDGTLPYTGSPPTANASPVAINSVTSTNSPTALKMMDPNVVSSQQLTNEMDDYATVDITPDSTPSQVTQWLTNHRLTAYLTTFTHFCGADIMRMSKEDLIQICGLADGIRMFNILRAKTIAPRLTIYVSLDGNCYNAIYLISNTAKELTQKIFRLPGFYEMIAKSANANNGGGLAENGAPYGAWGMHSKYSGSGSNIFNDVSKSLIYVSGPSGVHVAVTDEVLNNEIKDGSLYAFEVQNGKVVMKLVNKNDN